MIYFTLNVGKNCGTPAGVHLIEGVPLQVLLHSVMLRTDLGESGGAGHQAN